MPVERSRGSRRSGADGNQLVWTMPVEPASESGISFTTNLTPITFNDADPGPSMTGDVPESDLFPFANDSSSSSSPRRPAHSKKKAENHIPRPPNAFILFRSSFIKGQHVSTEVETNHSTLSKIIGLTWQNLPEDERQVWHSKAKAALDDHRRKFPQYAFRPLHAKAKGGTEKRKVREVGPKDMKRCAKIAELLVEGKKGQELDAAIQEFDKYHVPEMVTRFEAPITERTFQRASDTNVKTEDSDSIDAAPSRPSRSTTRSPHTRPSSVGKVIPPPQPRSTSPGPPPLIDREQAELYLPSPISLPPPPSPHILSSASYSFSEEGLPIAHHAYPYNPIPDSPVPLTSSSTSSITENLMPSDFDIFDSVSSNVTDGRPSLSIDTSSYSNASVGSLMDAYTTTTTSSPISMHDLSIPPTPYSMFGSCTPAFSNSYEPIHALRHTASSHSLESNSSLESLASFEDLSSAYSHEYCSPTTPGDYFPYTPEPLPMAFGPGNDLANFTSDDYGHPLSDPINCSVTGIDEITFEKAQAQYPYQAAFHSFTLSGHSTFLSPPLSLGPQ
ncbi:hypothetical protein C8R42DRAFT_714948 [Lentinula raphanica]|nr:hypothetical protein C8R42DRAFT_714948 [Lentinula raphanica]